MNEEFESIIREKIDVYGESKLAKTSKTYSINFMRELSKIRNIKKIFKQWYWDDIEYPNVIFRELHQMSFLDYIKELFPYYKEFWKDWI